jgi:hypothetical protein
LNALILACALALPSHLDSDYYLLKSFIEKKYPHFVVVYVNEDEKILDKGAKRLPFYVMGKTFKKRGLQVWLLNRSS